MSFHSADRDADCQKAVEPAFYALMEQMEEAGWSGGETARALFSLAVDNIKAVIGGAELRRAALRTKHGIGEF